MARLRLIVRTVYGARNAYAPLLGSLESEGLLDGRVEVSFVDGDPSGEALRAEREGEIPVVLYGLSTLSYLELRGEIGRVASRFHVVAGGPHVEGAYWQVLRDGVEYAVVGDGEAALPWIVKYYLGEADSSDIPNVATFDGSRFKVSRIVHVDLDEYPAYTRRYPLYPPIEIMRGCHYTCKFCQVPWLFKRRVRYRSVERVLEAVEHYVRAGGKRRIRFTAPIGFAYMSWEPGRINYEAIEELLKGVRRLRATPFLGSFPSETRPEYVDDKVLGIVKRYAGNRRISLGLQTGSERLLEATRRGHTVEDALEAVRTVLRAGLLPVVDIIFGLPGETVEDVEETVRVMRTLSAWRARMRLHTFMPLPGTPMALERPVGIHPLYREVARRLAGMGLVEGYWEDQEDYAWRIYCLMASDPKPTREPQPLSEAVELCRERGYWKAGAWRA